MGKLCLTVLVLGRLDTAQPFVDLLAQRRPIRVGLFQLGLGSIAGLDCPRLLQDQRVAFGIELLQRDCTFRPALAGCPLPFALNRHLDVVDEIELTQGADSIVGAVRAFLQQLVCKLAIEDEQAEKRSGQELPQRRGRVPAPANATITRPCSAIGNRSLVQVEEHFESEGALVNEQGHPKYALRVCCARPAQIAYPNRRPGGRLTGQRGPQQFECGRFARTVGHLYKRNFCRFTGLAGKVDGDIRTAQAVNGPTGKTNLHRRPPGAQWRS